MNSPLPLVMPRRLAIVILHEAQVAQPQAIHGWVEAANGEPHRFVLGDSVPEAPSVWARLWSHPQAPAVPDASQLDADGLSLVVSLNTKGVLEMRAWELRDGRPAERVLKIRD